MKKWLTGFPDLLHFVLGPLCTFHCFAEPYCSVVCRRQHGQINWRPVSGAACENYSQLISKVYLLVFSVTDAAGVFLFWRVPAVAARAALTGGRTKIVYRKGWLTQTENFALLYNMWGPQRLPLVLHGHWWRDSQVKVPYWSKSMYV